MDLLVIAPTASYRRGSHRKEINDTIKDSQDAIRLEQKVGSEVPKGSDKSGTVVEQKSYHDMQCIHKLHIRNRARDLQVYEMDELYSKRPLYNISFPDMTKNV